MKEKRIGIFGGTFDPPHKGHLELAKDAFEQMKLDKVIFIPAAKNPLKNETPIASNYDRLNMLKILLDDIEEPFEISSYELEANKISYTIDTVNHYRKKFGNTRFYLIIGGDLLANLHKWSRLDKLANLVEFIYVDRPGYQMNSDAILSNLKINKIKGHNINISSSEIRENISNELTKNCYLHKKVVDYILEHKIYIK